MGFLIFTEKHSAISKNQVRINACQSETMIYARRQKLFLTNEQIGK